MTDRSIENILSITLRAGIVASTLFLLIGIVLLLNRPELAATYESSSVRETLQTLSRYEFAVVIRQPIVHLYIGIFLLMLTPILRVAMAVIGFSMERDWRFASISLFVLAVIAASVVYALR